jgi:hypothetical protein
MYSRTRGRACSSSQWRWPHCSRNARDFGGVSRPVSAVMMVAMASATQLYAFLTNPASAMAPHDADEHLGSGIFSGVGIRPAIEFMEAEARGGSFTLLTDPIWGPPADAMYPYLNHRHGIRVYDAWWMQLSETHPILPHEPKLVSRSQYERVPDGVVDFPNVPRVMYVTATNYNTPVQVARREPAARLIARFPRPNGREFINVYRLR